VIFLENFDALELPFAWGGGTGFWRRAILSQNKAFNKPRSIPGRREEEGEALPQMNDGQSTTHPEPDPAPFKVHLLTRAGRVMRARSEPVRAFSNKDEAVRFAGRQLGGHYAVYHKHKKIWPAS
jgi:hypothetical protein